MTHATTLSGRLARAALALAGTAALVAGVLVPIGGAETAAEAATDLKGTLVLDPGTYNKTTKKYSGTIFRMLQPGGTDRYLVNADSSAPDKTYQLLKPGTDGGLQLGRYQRVPSKPFDANLNSLAKRITQPQKFFGTYWSPNTAPTDAQSGLPTPAPSLKLSGNKLTGDFSAWTPGWNGIYFNQGSPKPGDDKYPGYTSPLSGTYNKSTHKFKIRWRSLIVGGPFNNFTGEWTLEGVLADNTIGLKTAKKSVSVKRGKTAKVKATASNWTEKNLKKTKISISAPKNLRLKKKTASVSATKRGANKTVNLKLSVGKKAKKGKHKVQLIWKAGGKSISRTVTVRVR
ncbi:hypothetical protein J4H92_06860 [Leucobacter weissii]|uniref:Alpha-galactosidase NEW3 domain-containing protein n=1 Tax=Leucobacter weissii TaxID=1983706 RepID=A0A939MN79_9MICO|nr:NEW3 domain-containing protein [Leucobacter weissii]MBO1901672.1 hypothetical protein [Leucobacter weissii]